MAQTLETSAFSVVLAGVTDRNVVDRLPMGQSDQDTMTVMLGTVFEPVSGLLARVPELGALVSTAIVVDEARGSFLIDPDALQRVIWKVDAITEEVTFGEDGDEMRRHGLSQESPEWVLNAVTDSLDTVLLAARAAVLRQQAPMRRAA